MWSATVMRSGTTLLDPVGPQFPYLAVHLVEGLADPSLQARPPVVSEVAREAPSFLEEHARILQLGELGLGHLPVIGAAPFRGVSSLRLLLR
jgi:hypothetical protein